MDNLQALKEDLEEKKIEYAELCSRSGVDEQEASRITKEYIKLLHQYNDIKDSATALLGIYAVNRELTIAEVYDKFNVPTED
ncbi:DNA repair protein, partial [Phycomyces nitens]